MFLSLFGEIYVRQGVDLKINLEKFQMRHEWFSFYGVRLSDEGGGTDLIK